MALGSLPYLTRRKKSQDWITKQIRQHTIVPRTGRKYQLEFIISFCSSCLSINQKSKQDQISEPTTLTYFAHCDVCLNDFSNEGKWNKGYCNMTGDKEKLWSTKVTNALGSSFKCAIRMGTFYFLFHKYFQSIKFVLESRFLDYKCSKYIIDSPTWSIQSTKKQKQKCEQLNTVINATRKSRVSAMDTEGWRALHWPLWGSFITPEVWNTRRNQPWKTRSSKHSKLKKCQVQKSLWGDCLFQVTTTIGTAGQAGSKWVTGEMKNLCSLKEFKSRFHTVWRCQNWVSKERRNGT